MADDRRAAIEAALDAAETEEEIVGATPSPAPAPENTPSEVTPEEGEQSATPAPAPKASAVPKPPTEGDEQGNPLQKQYSVDKPPQSWKPAQKAKWNSLDPEVRQEIIRRERDNERILEESSSNRQIVGAFQQALQPFAARIQAMGVHPIQAVQELFKADYMLSTAPPVKRAQYMAQLIKEYEIDIQALDAALSGQVVADPQAMQQDRIDQLLQERLSPFLKFIQQQNQENQARQEQETQQMTAQIQSMVESDKHPYFDDLRDEMADIIEISAKRGVYLSLEQAYTRAVALNPEISKLVAQQADGQRRTAAARQAHQRAQRALGASVSVSGSPSAVSTGEINGNDRRATIAAAMDQLEGR